MENIRLTQPSYTQLERLWVNKAMRKGWGKGAYSFIHEFENRMAKFTHRKYALATSSGTGALHLALLALGIGKGDEVIVPEITYASTGCVVAYTGAKAVYCDISPTTWCIDPQQIERLITDKTKVIITVDLYGHPCDYRKIMALAKKHHLKVVDDACEAVGTTYDAKNGDIVCLSFEGTKTISTGEGGMLLTDNKRIYEKAKYFNDDTDRKSKHWHEDIFWMYRYSDLQSALGIAQLLRIKKLIRKKRLIHSWYNKYLKCPTNSQSEKSSYWFNTALVCNKKKMVKKLKRYGIDARPAFYALSLQPPFKQHTDNSVAYCFSEHAINLPSGYELTEKMVERICNLVNE